jgi:hypothetical protein
VPPLVSSPINLTGFRQIALIWNNQIGVDDRTPAEAGGGDPAMYFEPCTLICRNAAGPVQGNILSAFLPPTPENRDETKPSL